MCPPGKYSDDGYKQCLRCSIGKYNQHRNLRICESCAQQMTTLGEGSTTCVCEKGAYMNNGTCVVCPDEVTCDKDGATLATVDLKPGVWRSNDNSDGILECPVTGSCLGGNNSTDDKYVKEKEAAALLTHVLYLNIVIHIDSTVTHTIVTTSPHAHARAHAHTHLQVLHGRSQGRALRRLRREMAPSCVHFYLYKVRRGHVGVHHIYSLCHRWLRHRCHHHRAARSAFWLEPSKTR